LELEHKVATKSWRVPGTLGSNGTITEGMVVLRIFSFHGGGFAECGKLETSVFGETARKG
jgi:hypothetical protein